MNPTQILHDFGQSLWLDNITRGLLTSGTLQHYIHKLTVTGLTSNPTIFERAISASDDYDADILAKAADGMAVEDLFFDLALSDLRQSADLFSKIHEQTVGVDGWVSLEVSPLLVDDTAGTLAAAKKLFALAARPNLFIKIPGTKAGLPAIEEAIFSGIPINVTLLFSAQQYEAAAGAYMRGIERRIAAGLRPDVASVASVFISRWDVAIKNDVPESLQNQLGITIAQQAYASYLELLESPRMQRLLNAGARPQRLLWASTGTKDPKFPDTFYLEALAAPLTINTIPEDTLKALADHGKVASLMSRKGECAATSLQKFTSAGIDTAALAAKLQDDGAKAFTKSWNSLMACIEGKSRHLKQGSNSTRPAGMNSSPGHQA